MEEHHDTGVVGVTGEAEPLQISDKFSDRSKSNTPAKRSESKKSVQLDVAPPTGLFPELMLPGVNRRTTMGLALMSLSEENQAEDYEAARRGSPSVSRKPLSSERLKRSEGRLRSSSSRTSTGSGRSVVLDENGRPIIDMLTRQRTIDSARGPAPEGGRFWEGTTPSRSSRKSDRSKDLNPAEASELEKSLSRGDDMYYMGSQGASGKRGRRRRGKFHKKDTLNGKLEEIPGLDLVFGARGTHAHMTGKHKFVSLSDIISFWDHASRPKRRKYLMQFINVHGKNGGTPLEDIYGDGASLILTRVVSWMQLTYRTRSSLTLQLKTLDVFFSSSSGPRFIREFVVAGGILTVLDVIDHPKTLTSDQELCLRVVERVSSCGRVFKELICEHHGVKIIVNYLMKCTERNVLHWSQRVLESLGVGNPRYASRLHEALFVTFVETSTTSCKIVAARALSSLLSRKDYTNDEEPYKPDIRYVRSSIQLFEVDDLQVHHEAYRLVGLLCSEHGLMQETLESLEEILRADEDTSVGLQKREAHIEASDFASLGRVSDLDLPVNSVQGCAMKMLLKLAESSHLFASRIASRGSFVPSLVKCLCNVNNFELQQLASHVLFFLNETVPVAIPSIRHYLGPVVYRRFIAQPEAIHRTLSETDVELALQKVNGSLSVGIAMKEIVRKESEETSEGDLELGKMFDLDSVESSEKNNASEPSLYRESTAAVNLYEQLTYDGLQIAEKAKESVAFSAEERKKRLADAPLHLPYSFLPPECSNLLFNERANKNGVRNIESSSEVFLQSQYRKTYGENSASAAYEDLYGQDMILPDSQPSVERLDEENVESDSDGTEELDVDLGSPSHVDDKLKRMQAGFAIRDLKRQSGLETELNEDERKAKLVNLLAGREVVQQKSSGRGNILDLAMEVQSTGKEINPENWRSVKNARRQKNKKPPKRRGRRGRRRGDGQGGGPSRSRKK